jgi:hypothetical protein
METNSLSKPIQLHFQELALRPLAIKKTNSVTLVRERTIPTDRATAACRRSQC